MDTRLIKLRSLMNKQGVDAVLVSSVANIIYLSGFDYFNDLERDGYLLITKKKQYLITSSLYSHAAKKIVKNYEVLEVKAGKSFLDYLTDITKNKKITTLGIETDNLTVSEYNRFSKKVKSTKHFDLSTLRISKTENEISLIKKACEIGDKAYSYILKNLRIGMTEKEIAFELEIYIRKTGANISFDTIVAFGANAAIPHHKTSDQKLKMNQCVLIDFGVKYQNYSSDMTRTFFFGKASSEDKKVYETVLSAQKKSIEYIEKQLNSKQKAIATKVDGIARDFVVQEGYPPFNHSSHGIGLEVHELPHISNSKDPLENGMVFSIEPGIYLPDRMGVRIEDLFAIENNKLIPLTRSTKELLEI
ncbi:MAG TPA: Xaa-Pro peptidase family protein [Candidatus Saccharimonadales bacterium]|nr:Xaa-Pro peptidase family protein [Candidatus Saccharimonadales bacterium]